MLVSFAWEEVTPGGGGGGGSGPSRLLAVTESRDVRLVSVVTGAAEGVGLVCVSECSAQRLLTMAQDRGSSECGGQTLLTYH